MAPVRTPLSPGPGAGETCYPARTLALTPATQPPGTRHKQEGQSHLPRAPHSQGAGAIARCTHRRHITYLGCRLGYLGLGPARQGAVRGRSHHDTHRRGTGRWAQQHSDRRAQPIMRRETRRGTQRQTKPPKHTMQPTRAPHTHLVKSWSTGAQAPAGPDTARDREDGACTDIAVPQTVPHTRQRYCHQRTGTLAVSTAQSCRRPAPLSHQCTRCHTHNVQPHTELCAVHPLPKPHKAAK
jgi:hypothetical protein